jgi:hypothetical protein
MLAQILVPRPRELEVKGVVVRDIDLRGRKHLF